MMSSIKPIHPFPARMAPELIQDELPVFTSNRRKPVLLDPMVGSGSTVTLGRLRGYEAIGYDRDPLAVLISQSWSSDVDAEKLERKTIEILRKAVALSKNLSLTDAYPQGADDETRKFVDFWFDDVNRVQLASLATSIGKLRDVPMRNLLWCAFSRLIITKKVGVSRAMDVSHSRPHRKYDEAPIRAFDHFERSVRHIIKCSPFTQKNSCPSATINFGDARQLPLRTSSVDVIITSPPYLNAIDYMRGHKLSLVWMQHSIDKLRNIRSTNVGAEVTDKPSDKDVFTEKIMCRMCTVANLSDRQSGMLRRYVKDMTAILREAKRVLRPKGKAVFVVGDCNLSGVFIKNSKCIEDVAVELGMSVTNVRHRPLPENRRYLPPPKSSGAGKELKKRMNEEIIITLIK